MSIALKDRAIKFDYFSEEVRSDPELKKLAAMLTVTAPAEIDNLYPKLRPARVSVTTARGTFTRQVDEALGSRLVPLDDGGLLDKFYDLVSPILGASTASPLMES